MSDLNMNNDTLENISLDISYVSKASDIIKGAIAMIEELEKENAMLRDEVKLLAERLK